MPMLTKRQLTVGVTKFVDAFEHEEDSLMFGMPVKEWGIFVIDEGDTRIDFTTDLYQSLTLA